MATILGILLPLFRLLEAFLEFRARDQEKRFDNTAILRLREYREKLEQALEARRKSRLEHGLDDDPSTGAERLPDDGYRRD